MNFLDGMYLSIKNRVANFFMDLKNEEHGVSAIVATVLLILIAVMLAAIFWDTIKGWFDDMMAKILGESDTIKR